MAETEEFYWPAANIVFEEGGQTQIGLYVKPLGTLYVSAKFDVELFRTPPGADGKEKWVVRKVDKRLWDNPEDSILNREVAMYDRLVPDAPGASDHFGTTAKLLWHQTSPAVAVNDKTALWTAQSTWEFFNLGSVADRWVANRHVVLLDEQVGVARTVLLWVQKQNERADVRDIVVHNDLRGANIVMNWDAESAKMRFAVIDLDIAYDRGRFMDLYDQWKAGGWLHGHRPSRPHNWWDINMLFTAEYQHFFRGMGELGDTEGCKRLQAVLDQLKDADADYSQPFEDAALGDPNGRLDGRIPDLQPYLDKLDELAGDILADKVHVLPCEGDHKYRIDKYLRNKVVDDWEEDEFGAVDPSVVPYQAVCDIRARRLQRAVIRNESPAAPENLEDISTVEKAMAYWGGRVSAPCFLVKVDKNFRLLDTSNAQILGKQYVLAVNQAETMKAQSPAGTKVDVSMTLTGSQ